MTESSSITLAPFLLRNLITSIFIFADKSLLFLSEKYKLLEFLRYLICSAFLFSLRILPTIFPSLNPSANDYNYNYSVKPPKADHFVPAAATGGGGCESGIGRALSQLLSIVNQLPVSSRKYEVVRSLAEKLIDENILEVNEALKEVNRAALSSAFSRTLGQLEAAVIHQKRYSSNDGEEELRRGEDNVLTRTLRKFRYYGYSVWRYGRSRGELNRSGNSAEKWAAELLWLAGKLTESGCAAEAVTRWAAASNLAWLALFSEPRLQGSIVKVSAFLFKQAKEMKNEEEEEATKVQNRQTKMKMLMSWLPLLCRSSGGIDTPVLNSSERVELERTLEDIIETLEEDEEQEKVLSLWLHHFTYCASSDWPNLLACYTRWCTSARQLLLR